MKAARFICLINLRERVHFPNRWTLIKVTAYAPCHDARMMRHPQSLCSLRLRHVFGSALLLLLWALFGMATAQAPHVQRFLSEAVPNSLVERATSYGELHPDLPVAPLLGPEGRWAGSSSLQIS